MLDPLSAFVFAALFSLFNGAVLGFMHRALAPELQPSAADWRIGTLLMAAGSMLFVGQAMAEVQFAQFVIPITNACWLIGLALYWRSVRRYFAVPDTWWIFAPVLVGVVLIAFFTFVVPNIGQRINVATACWATLLCGGAWTLLSHRERENSISCTVLSGIFLILAALILLRGAYYFMLVTVVVSLATPISQVNALTPLLLAVLPVIGTTAYVLLCFERIRRELQRVATTDALTGLPNRLTINERAASLFAQRLVTVTPLAAVAGLARRRDFAIAIIDIDHFKNVNDRHGHGVGDIVLQGVARTLAAHCGADNFVGRQGGEEFVALLDGADQPGALAAAERLRTAVERSTYQTDEATLTATVSIGVASLNDQDDEFADILRRADRALYAAKAAGRNCVRYEVASADS